ncbi:MAG: WecB/TagA/CpsF family glycosyltransferase [Bdellovibrionales bacterium]
MQKTIASLVEIIRHLQLVKNEDQHKSLLARLAAKQEKPTVVSWLNSNALTLAQKDQTLAVHLLKSDFLLRDGVGISILLHCLKWDSGLNMNGTDLIPEIVRTYAGRKVALFGTHEDFLSRAAESIEKMGCKVVLRMDGFQEPEDYLKQLTKHEADLVILGMGVPKQEEVAFYLASRLTRPALILNGGAILDFLAGRFPRAPKIWRQLRLEWVFRILQEPLRLGRRYTVGGVLFFILTARIVRAMKPNALVSNV